jgi:TonB family protein
MLVVLYLILIAPNPHSTLKTATEKPPLSSMEAKETRVGEGNETIREEGALLDAIAQGQAPTEEEREEQMHSKVRFDKEERPPLGQSTPAASPVLDAQDSLFFSGSISDMKWTQVDIAGPAATRQVLKLVEPEYPTWAKDEQVKGMAEVMCLILPSGETARTAIWLTSGWPELDQSALQAVGEWTFEPLPAEELQAGIVRLTFDFSRG